MVETVVFVLIGTLFYPPLAIMRVYSMLRHYGRWVWAVIAILALAFDGAYLHPFATATLGLLVIAEVFDWNWKRLGIAMTALAAVWGYLISWWVVALIPLLWGESWADA
ncbi:hypothetical protein HPY42_02945 [Coprothermobacteraceae bacterium]|nr:hypothetical protein [Coprothermobacteraceae bacterium]